MKTPASSTRQINQYTWYKSIIFILVLISINTFSGISQVTRYRQRIYFISDIQAPLPVERILLKPYRNEEARDKLFSDIINHHPENLFMLGDLTSRGSEEKSWAPLDSFLDSLKINRTSVYPIPGNHEYMGISSHGIQLFKRRFEGKCLTGYFVNIDSVVIVMLNSNFDRLTENEFSEQLIWYRSEMDSLDADPAIKTIIVCTHHSPFSNSKIVGSSKPVRDLIVPIFETSRKSGLFISGHSHNLEYFSGKSGKYYLVIGGGGGIEQPLVPLNKRKYYDLTDEDGKPLYFYLILENEGDCLKLIARGFKEDFKFFEYYIGAVTTGRD